MSTDREKLLEDALVQFIKPIKGIPFEVIIKSLCGVEVERFDLSIAENVAVLEIIVTAMKAAGNAVRTTPIIRPRPNEVGNDMEPFVIGALKANGLSAAAPRTKGGFGKATGYPDVRIATSTKPIFIEVKTYAIETHLTTMRSFYLSPAEDPKVFEDGYHLLVGFEMVRNGNSYSPSGFKMVDLYGLVCDMKSEFNSDNRRLYEKGRLLAQERL